MGGVTLTSCNSDARLRRPKTALLIDALVPASAGAETSLDAPESSMFPIEAAVVANAASGRRREFATVRHCARQALQRIGVPTLPILPDADGVPQWPDGVVGSLTHCSGYRGAIVARSEQLHAIGIDAEPHAELAAPARDLVLRGEERARLRKAAGANPEMHWDRILFSAKEAVFKAWFPLTRRWLDFADVSTTVDPDGTFAARVLVRGAPALDREPGAFTGRWVVDRGLVVTATSIPGSASR
jgi:4'-phosphopantetheinyl transferase EntD